MTIAKVTAGMAFVAFVAIIVSEECQGFSPTIIPRTAAFFPRPIDVPRRTSSSSLRWRNFHHIHRFATHLHAISDEAVFLSDDPFVILGLDAPTTDKKILKRAFKKRALKFHPDVVTDIHSSPEEKKKASDRFAKINGAYAQLMGKGGKSSSSSNTGTNESTTSGWTPPHRRSSSYKSSSSRSYSEGDSTDWRDYMPDYRKDSDADYDTGGDSFSQIFSDMFTGATGAAMSGGIGGVGGGIFNEFLEFLEGGSAGFASSSGGGTDDADLRELLQTATIEEISEEMDDTQMVVQQLETKARNLDDEIFAMDAEAKMASRFSEKIALEERASELKARKEVVGGYLDRARKRLLKLQTYYKDNMGRRSSSEWQDVRNEASGGSSYSSSSSYGSTSTRTTETPGASSTEASSSKGDDESWKTEGFGSSSGRSRRGSGRRRARNRSSAGVDSNPPPAPPSPAPSPPPPPPSYSTSSRSTSSSPRQSTTTTQSSSSSAVSRSNYSNDVPPHRRARGSQSFASRQEEDRKRMQEIKVDEEFDKLKKELGL